MIKSMLFGTLLLSFKIICSSSNTIFRFCFDADASRPLLELEKKFFNESRSWNSKSHKYLNS